ncbi:collagen alpha-1(IV) chain-like [Gadus morhua]|uniref:collagen alpha-1(IV) chain-like n=1 Tax=Gadus morhua TaxID=8049 RepID=UPI0011B3D83D|nr:collagen alpha-1(IV) chain-like [Gadus morhua]
MGSAARRGRRPSVDGQGAWDRGAGGGRVTAVEPPWTPPSPVPPTATPAPMRVSRHRGDRGRRGDRGTVVPMVTVVDVATVVQCSPGHRGHRGTMVTVVTGPPGDRGPLGPVFSVVTVVTGASKQLLHHCFAVETGRSTSAFFVVPERGRGLREGEEPLFGRTLAPCLRERAL